MSERWGGRKVMKLRAQWAPRVEAGQVDCGRCGLPIAPGSTWDLGHRVDRALGGTAADGLHPEHAGPCNRAAGGRLGHALRRRTTSPPPLVKRRSWL